MNYFTRVVGKPVTDEMDCCEHLTVGMNAYRITSEIDGFGVVGRFAMCEACAKALDEAEDNELVTCHDCNTEFPRRETVEWTPYDYYPAQGDEPTIVCQNCKGKLKHQQRVARDRADQEREFGYDDDTDGY